MTPPLHLDCGLPRCLEKDSLFVLKLRLYATREAGLRDVQCLVESEDWLDGAKLKKLPAIPAQGHGQVVFNLKSRDSGTAGLGLWIKCRDGSAERLFHAMVEVKFTRGTAAGPPVHISAQGPSVHHAGGTKEGFGQEVSGNVTVNVTLPAPQHVQDATQDAETQWGSPRLIEMPGDVWPGTGVKVEAATQHSAPAPAAPRSRTFLLLANSGGVLLLAALVFGVLHSRGGRDGGSFAPQAIESPPTISVDRPRYSEGESQRVTVTVRQDGWLYVGCINPDGKVPLYFPNPHSPEARVQAGQTITLPPEGQPWSIKTELPPGVRLAREHVFATLSTQPLPDVKLEWGRDQRGPLEQAGFITPGAWLTGQSRGMPREETYPSSITHRTQWADYEVLR